MWFGFSFTSSKLLSVWLQSRLHAEKEQSSIFLETEAGGTRAKCLQMLSELPGDWPITSSLPSGKVWQGKWEPRPPEQSEQVESWSHFSRCCPGISGKKQNSNCREATFAEKYLDQWRYFTMKKTTKTQKQKKKILRVWTWEISTAFVFRSWLRWGDWVWSQAQQRDGF